MSLLPLFSQLFLSQIHHAEVRKACVSYMRQHQSKFESVSSVSSVSELGVCGWEVLWEAVSGLAPRTRWFVMFNA